MIDAFQEAVIVNGQVGQKVEVALEHAQEGNRYCWEVVKCSLKMVVKIVMVHSGRLKCVIHTLVQLKSIVYGQPGQEVEVAQKHVEEGITFMWELI